jgi:hypothetical protein
VDPHVNDVDDLGAGQEAGVGRRTTDARGDRRPAVLPSPRAALTP